jgi:hypothetical protein
MIDDGNPQDRFAEGMAGGTKRPPDQGKGSDKTKRCVGPRAAQHAVVRLTKPYSFDGSSEKQTLADLFDGMPQLILQSPY